MSGEIYADDTGEWPARLSDLYTQPTAFIDWRGPYLEISDSTRRAIQDPWKREYIFLKGSGYLAVGSFGEDGRPGGKPDHFVFIRTGS